MVVKTIRCASQGIPAPAGRWAVGFAKLLGAPVVFVALETVVVLTAAFAAAGPIAEYPYLEV